MSRSHDREEKEEEEEEEKYKEDDLLILKPAGLLIKLMVYQAEFISNYMLSLSSPFLQIASDSFHRAKEESRDNAEDTVNAATKVPIRVAEGGALFLKKLGFGLLGAVYVGAIMLGILILAVIMGVGLVRLWLEEPVFVREALHFDYTDVNPTAVFPFQGQGQEQGGKNKVCFVPVGQTFHVSLVLRLPDSDFNRHIGVFQVIAEVISATGNVVSTSSQPCMLRFRSLPVRLMHAFVIGIPLLLGISQETQTITIPLLKHKEGNPRTEAIRVKLTSRAGTSVLPQLYSAEIIMNSQLPWTKGFVYKWKWTFYVWTSLYVYIISLTIVMCRCKHFLFPTMTMASDVQNGRDWSGGVAESPKTRRDGEAYESLRNWQPRRRGSSKRRTLFSHEDFWEKVGSSASSFGAREEASVSAARDEASVSAARDEASEVTEDFAGFTDGEGESVCVGG